VKRLPAQHLHQHRAEAEHVGASVAGHLADHQLRRAVAVARVHLKVEPRFHDLRGRARNSEFAHLHPLLGGDEDVGGVEIPVHERKPIGGALRVRVGQRGGDLTSHRDHRTLREAALLLADPLQGFAQGLAKRVLHRDVVPAAALARVVVADDVLVLELGCRPRVVEEELSRLLRDLHVGQGEAQGHLLAGPVARALDQEHLGAFASTDQSDRLEGAEQLSGEAHHGRGSSGAHAREINSAKQGAWRSDSAQRTPRVRSEAPGPMRPGGLPLFSVRQRCSADPGKCRAQRRGE
jgi:hypothetical protein